MIPHPSFDTAIEKKVEETRAKLIEDLNKDTLSKLFELHRQQLQYAQSERNAIIGMAYTMAIRLGYKVGIVTEEEHCIVYIYLPNGQVSWDIPIGDIAAYFPDNLEEYEGKDEKQTIDQKYTNISIYSMLEGI